MNVDTGLIGTMVINTPNTGPNQTGSSHKERMALDGLEGFLKQSLPSLEEALPKLGLVLNQLALRTKANQQQHPKMMTLLILTQPKQKNWLKNSTTNPSLEILPKK